MNPVSHDPPVYRLHIALKDMPFRVWRELLIQGDANLHQLHRAIQAVMPWQSYHLYRFEAEGHEYTHPDMNDGELGFEDSTGVRLMDVAPEPGAQLVYEYDFGDSWMHGVKVQEILTSSEAAERAPALPACLRGERACPPEDCGGPGGYTEMLRVLSDPRDEEYESMLEWSGGSWDPDTFDLHEANRRLRPREYWRAHPPSQEVDAKDAIGLWFGEADAEFIEEIEAERSPATVQKYRNALYLFRAYMENYSPDCVSWLEVGASDFRMFFSYFLPRKVSPSPSEAKSILSGLNGFTKWLDREYRMRLREEYAPVYRQYRDTLPNACEAADLLREHIWMLQMAKQKESWRQVGVRYVVEHWNTESKEEIARKLAELAAAADQAKQDDEDAPMVEGMWTVEDVEGEIVTLELDELTSPEEEASDLDAMPAPRQVRVPFPENVATLLEPGFSLYLSLRRRDLGWVIVDAGTVYPG